MAKKQTSPIQVLIENIKADQKLLTIKDELLTTARNEKKEISTRLKGFKADVNVLFKYLSKEEQIQIEELGYGPNSSESGLNSIAQFALDIILEKKKLTNGELYNEYIDASPENSEVLTYSIFNVKIRPVFNTGLVDKEKTEDGKDTRDDLIFLRGEE